MRPSAEHVAAQLAAIDLTDAARARGDREAEERVFTALALGRYAELLEQLRAHRERLAGSGS